jgi:hypothetical protein
MNALARPLRDAVFLQQLFQFSPKKFTYLITIVSISKRSSFFSIASQLFNSIILFLYCGGYFWTDNNNNKTLIEWMNDNNDQSSFCLFLESLILDLYRLVQQSFKKGRHQHRQHWRW